MQEVYKEIREADGIIWASPVYYWSMSGLTKTALDRTFALNFPKLQQAGKIGGLILVAGIRGCMSAANPFHMYFIYNHMFAAEFTWGYAGEKGAIKKDTFAITMAKTMVGQMHALFQANLKYPEEFDMPLHRLVREKLGG
jgi:multimeric flavodoxin WrbA